MVAEDLSVVADGRGMAAPGAVGVAAVEVGGDVVGVELHDAVEVRDCLGVLPPAGVEDAALEARRLVLGGQGDGLRQVGEGLIGLAQVREGGGAGPIGGGVVWVRGQGRRAVGHRPLVAAAEVVGDGPADQDGGVGGLQVQGLMKIGDGPLVIANQTVGVAPVGVQPGIGGVSLERGGPVTDRLRIVPLVVAVQALLEQVFALRARLMENRSRGVGIHTSVPCLFQAHPLQRVGLGSGFWAGFAQGSVAPSTVSLPARVTSDARTAGLIDCGRRWTDPSV